MTDRRVLALPAFHSSERAMLRMPALEAVRETGVVERMNGVLENAMASMSSKHLLSCDPAFDLSKDKPI